MTSNDISGENRHNFYHAIHKALRLGHCRMLPALGALDHRDRSKTETLLAELRIFIDLCRSHLEGENREIHAALEERAPGASAHAADDHHKHEESFTELEDLIRAVEQAPADKRERAVHHLYQNYAIFAAHDLAHMNVEETEMLAALQNAFTDDELMAIEGRIVAAVPPHKMTACMMLLAPALNHGERVALLTTLQKALPEPVFGGLLSNAVKPALAAPDYVAVVGEMMLRAA